MKVADGDGVSLANLAGSGALAIVRRSLRPMLPIWIASLLALCLTAVVGAQTYYPVGSHYPQLPNTCGSGTPVLDVAIHYPAVSAGLAAPMLPCTGGWPVVVFLHGFNLIGLDYDFFGRGLASQGFAVVMLNTARTSYANLDEDARSLPDALAVLNETPGPFFGGLNLQRMGLMGHSMGGGVTSISIARSDAYRCGFALAPVFPGFSATSLVSVPFGILVGAGDAATPWLLHSQPYYQSLGTTEGLRFLYVMKPTADHLNIAGLAVSQQSPILLRSIDITASFFRHFLCGDQFALERCLGEVARTDPNLSRLQQQVFVPQTWVAGPARTGRTTRISVAAVYGVGGVLGAAQLVGGLPTPFGTLYLEPSSAFAVAVAPSSQDGRIDVQLSVPSNPALVGMSISLQGLGAATNDPVLLGSALEITVTQ